jgi:hypothetical protein
MASLLSARSVMKGRIKSLNEAATPAYTITRAVAFGDFLLDRVRVKAAEVGVELQPRTPSEGGEKKRLRPVLKRRRC